MEYSYKYDLTIKLTLTDNVFAFLTDAIRKDRLTCHALRHGCFWDTSMKYRKYGKKTLVTLTQFDQIILHSLGTLIENEGINQEVREFTVDLFMALKKIYQDSVLELKLLNDTSFKYSTPVKYI